METFIEKYHSVLLLVAALVFAFTKFCNTTQDFVLGCALSLLASYAIAAGIFLFTSKSSPLYDISVEK